jgi:hypothetical protein
LIRGKTKKRTGRGVGGSREVRAWKGLVHKMQGNIRLADSDGRERSSLSLPQDLAAAVLRQNSSKLLYCNY